MGSQCIPDKAAERTQFTGEKRTFLAGTWGEEIGNAGWKKKITARLKISE